MDHDFEIEFIKEFLDTVNLRNFWYNAPIELSDGYLLSGAVQRPNYLDDSFARRVDQQGNTVWFNYYGDYEITDVVNAMAKVNDTLIVLSNTTDVEGPNVSRVTIRYINGEGEVVKLWNSEPNPDIGYSRNIMVAADGGLIAFGVYLVEVIGGTSIVQPTLAKLDTSFQIEWLRHFGYQARLGADVIFWDIEQLSGGCSSALRRHRPRVVWRERRHLHRQMERAVGPLPDGVYFLQVLTEQGHWGERVVVRRA